MSNDALEAIDMFLDNGLKEEYDKDQNETRADLGAGVRGTGAGRESMTGS